MPSEEYTSAVGGGLKLKGSRPGGVTKKKKKKEHKPAKDTSPPSDTKKTALQRALEEEDADIEIDDSRLVEDEERGEGDSRGGKTAAEKAMEEMRRKRLHDRLAKEGVKTHKQRVEELNKYLSNLSEHHDMPRIGPG